MFEERVVAVFGIPAWMLVAGVGLLVYVTGFLWLRRIIGDEPDPDSFWATADRHADPSWVVILGVGLLGVVTLVGVTLLEVMTSGSPFEAGRVRNPADVVLIFGAALTGLAVLLAARRVWARYR